MKRLGCGYRGGWSFLLLSFLGSGCATEVSLASAIDAGRANELAATADYRGEQLRLLVVVTQTGLKRVGGAVGEFKPGYVAVTQTQTAYPYLYARDPARDQAGGRLLCFFEPSELRDVADVSAGQQVHVTGHFQQYSEHGATLVLRECKLR